MQEVCPGKWGVRGVQKGHHLLSEELTTGRWKARNHCEYSGENHSHSPPAVPANRRKKIPGAPGPQSLLPAPSGASRPGRAAGSRGAAGRLSPHAAFPTCPWHQASCFQLLSFLLQRHQARQHPPGRAR